MPLHVYAIFESSSTVFMSIIKYFLLYFNCMPQTMAIHLCKATAHAPEASLCQKQSSSLQHEGMVAWRGWQHWPSSPVPSLTECLLSSCAKKLSLHCFLTDCAAMLSSFTNCAFCLTCSDASRKRAKVRKTNNRNGTQA